MNNLIPAVLEKEKEKLKAEPYNVIEACITFDGTAQLAEALALTGLRDSGIRGLVFSPFVIFLLLQVCL